MSNLCLAKGGDVEKGTVFVAKDSPSELYFKDRGWRPVASPVQGDPTDMSAFRRAIAAKGKKPAAAPPAAAPAAVDGDK